MIVRRLLIIVAAVLLAIQVVRNAAVEALAELEPAQAARLWPSHPSVELSLGMLGIGRSSRAGAPVTPSSIATIDKAALKSPLAPEPYLVHGVQAQLAGRGAAARRDFVAAQWRDPRSLPAAYFLADYDFRNGRPIEGLKQAAILARLSPGGPTAIAPYVAAYAQRRENWPQIRVLFRSEPEMEGNVLAAMAANVGNADAVLALADSSQRKPDSPWLKVLLRGLVDDGQYGRARSVWASVSGVPAASGSLLYDPGFSAAGAPPPFNWDLTSSTIGLAERQPGGRLHVLFYGQPDGVLASQLLLLSAGAYRLQMQLSPGATHPETLSWSVRCANSSEPFARAGVEPASAKGWTFLVPLGCDAQWLELSGRSGDIAQQSDATIGGLRLNRVGRGG